MTDCYTRPYYGDRRRISVILSFPDIGQQPTSLDKHGSHALSTRKRRSRTLLIPLFFVARCEAEGVLYVEPGRMHTCICGWSVHTGGAHREAILENSITKSFLMAHPRKF